jgi:hypothetical protein
LSGTHVNLDLEVLRSSQSARLFTVRNDNPVILAYIKVLFPTEGNPTKPTLATPVLATSKPIPGPPPLDLGSISSLRSLASLAEECRIRASARGTLLGRFTGIPTFQLTQMVRGGLVLLGLGHLILDGVDLCDGRRHLGRSAGSSFCLVVVELPSVRVKNGELSCYLGIWSKVNRLSSVDNRFVIHLLRGKKITGRGGTLKLKVSGGGVGLTFLSTTPLIPPDLKLSEISTINMAFRHSYRLPTDHTEDRRRLSIV